MSLLRHCVGGKLLDKHGTVDEPRVTFPRGTASVLEGRERSQPYRTSTRSRADIYNTELTLVSGRTSQSPSRPTQDASSLSMTFFLAHVRCGNKSGCATLLLRKFQQVIIYRKIRQNESLSSAWRRRRPVYSGPYPSARQRFFPPHSIPWL